MADADRKGTWTKDMTFKQKLAYFWDYYKWPTIITIVIIALIVGFVLEQVRRVDPDVEILYAGPAVLVATDANVAPEESLAKLIEDYNGDGKIKAFLNLMYFNNNPEQYDQYEAAQQMSLMAALSAGEVYIVIMDDAHYDVLREQGAFADLTQVVGRSLEDPTSIPLGETALIQMEGFETMDPSLHLALISRRTKLTEDGERESIAYYEKMEELFVKLAG